ncbi:CRISPR-associated helicase/endonuclease Cas3 [Chamaesiphon minutus]|uniref:CRISPR-associated helicase Cas3/CRISPR-associated endonuclease Cas3-HD n=1 Tax=Chamaesiphon minutus (strain ATCC 27169 / PCC 6605) TaxID=1173020 RepID=K9UG00_CHAP6|nr:CRISPR-associated helicase/endonuclease Cas3 [Chamaesiphon minutus]AFY93139.1 CRISPR-associated helicase Cas3/CRISPR-associated endonuclease Cas3-HD [Chamaesiphon minutus PCC 6605]
MLLPLNFVAHTPPPNDSQKWHDLKKHLTDVANGTAGFADKLGAQRLGYYAGLWHDLGKYNPEFKKYLIACAQGDKNARSIPHAVHGAILAAELIPPLALLIYGHHGGLPQKAQGIDRIGNPEHQPTYRLILEQAKTAGIDLSPKSDWESEISNFKNPFHYELFLRLLFSCLVDADFLDTEEHFSPELTAQRQQPETVQRLWTVLEKHQTDLIAKAPDKLVNRVRAEVYQACSDKAKLPPGVFSLAVPTGGGKTLSGLAFALKHAAKHGQDRVIVAVPYTSIIEQTVNVYRKIFGEAAVLEHHSAAKTTVDDEDARSQAAQARLATQNWDAPLIVTTTVQLFESLFHNRTSRCRKLHNIINSVIILDEVQTLPIGLLAPILNVLQELAARYNVTVVLCTATQPALEGNSRYLEGFERVEDIIEPEQAQEHFRQLSRVNYELPDEPWSWAQVVEDVQIHQHEQALLILNTRKDALELLAALPQDEPEQLFHLSTLLCGAHRRKVLEAVRSRLKQNLPCWLVSTQVVEAGVDLDFPSVYRALGPLDRIVQAAGRCNREGNSTTGRVVVFQPENGRTPPGDYATAVAETANLLRKQPNFDDPEIFRPYFGHLYQGTNTDKYKVQEARERFDYPETAQRFKLIPDDTQPVVIEYDETARKLIRQIERQGLKSRHHRALQPYLVNLRDREFKQGLEVRREIAPGIWVWEGGYDEVRGISLGGSAIVRDPYDLIV